jgi:hypothetical protein
MLSELCLKVAQWATWKPPVWSSKVPQQDIMGVRTLSTVAVPVEGTFERPVTLKLKDYQSLTELDSIPSSTKTRMFTKHSDEHQYPPSSTLAGPWPLVIPNILMLAGVPSTKCTEGRRTITSKRTCRKSPIYTTFLQVRSEKLGPLLFSSNTQWCIWSSHRIGSATL